MNIEVEKLKLVKLILETEDEAIIQKLKAVFEKTDIDFWSELPDSIKESINQGLEDIAANRVQNHDSVMQEIKAHYKINV